MERVNRILAHEDYRCALRQLALQEEGRVFCLHNMEHFLSVARIMRLCTMEEGQSFQQDVLYAAALLHDLGRAFCSVDGAAHAMTALDLAQDILNDCAFDSTECTQILRAIVAHNAQEGGGNLGRLLRKADQLSRNCFCCPAYDDCYWTAAQKNRGILL